MIFNGKLLSPSIRLFDLGVQRATTLHAVPRPRNAVAVAEDEVRGCVCVYVSVYVCVCVCLLDCFLVE